jgi:hypothetical protein
MSDEVKPGSETSEFTITKYVYYAGLALDGIGITLEALKEQGVNFGWLPTVLVIIGSLMVLLKALGYTRSRTMVKLAAAAPVAARGVAEVVPLLKELLEEIRQQRSQGESPTLPPVIELPKP